MACRSTFPAGLDSGWAVVQHGAGHVARHVTGKRRAPRLGHLRRFATAERNFLRSSPRISSRTVSVMGVRIRSGCRALTRTPPNFRGGCLSGPGDPSLRGPVAARLSSPTLPKIDEMSTKSRPSPGSSSRWQLPGLGPAASPVHHDLVKCLDRGVQS